jgi:DNA helicase-2/ATP-dependent DNA helicase PcrA
MNSEFTAAYKQLNTRQKQAVDTIYGPLLVIAGPGTGKTQLLSTRAANIVAKSDVAPGNILCLTYTDAGANEMRQRMGRIMGPSGGEVAVHTFHSFGSWLINQYPETFSQERALLPLDELGRYSVLEGLLQKLAFRHPLAIRDDSERFIRQHAVQEAIGAFKQAGMTPDAVRRQLTNNSKEYKALDPLLEQLFSSNFSVKRLDEIEDLAVSFGSEPRSFSSVLLESLAAAVEDSRQLGKTAPLGKWRDAHTTIRDGKRVLKSAAQATLLNDVVDLYEKYQKQLAKTGRFDYEDMILWATGALETSEDMRLDIAERFQYIMVDEYQDTNGAQNRLLDSLLKANPIDTPNVLVVGDDDQAIMRFQGAEVSGMLRFVEAYKPEVIVLDDNYRSGQPILDASRQIITQTDERLEVSLPDQNFTKLLKSAGGQPTDISHHNYASPAAEYAAVAAHVQERLKNGVAPNQIGVIGRKHAELVAFVPYLAALGINVAYDRRENILENTRISQLLKLGRYVNTLAEKPARASALLPEVLAADYWQLEPLDLYELASAARQEGSTWLDVMLGGSGRLHDIAEWLLAAAKASQNYNFTQMFDILAGRDELAETGLKNSPFAVCYQDQPPEIYLNLLSHLIRLREAVLATKPEASGLADMLDVCAQYRQSDLRLLDNNPILRGDSDSVQVMSAHGAKGREFEEVIMLSTLDEVWGSRARGNHQRVWLPENMPLYPAGDNESDKLRLLYVAMTRAKSKLLLTSYKSNDNGKAMSPLSFLMLGDGDGWWQAREVDTADKRAALEAAWRPVQMNSRDMARVLQPVLVNWRLSPTALHDFLDFRYGGPVGAIEKHVLKFPSAYNVHSALGNAVHKTLQLARANFAAGKPLDTPPLLVQFDDFLAASGLSEHELANARDHAHDFLPRFIKQFAASDFGSVTATEQFLTGSSPTRHVPLSGALDALAEDDKRLRVIDYKTGRPPLPDWQTKGLTDSKKVSLHFYRQQLLFYKLLVESSGNYAKQPVACAELVFVEDSAEQPDEFIRLSITEFDPEELDRLEQLIKIVYDRIIAADLPDTSNYSQDLKGITAFENDLLDGKI